MDAFAKEIIGELKEDLRKRKNDAAFYYRGMALAIVMLNEFNVCYTDALERNLDGKHAALLEDWRQWENKINNKNLPSKIPNKTHLKIKYRKVEQYNQKPINTFKKLNYGNERIRFNANSQTYIRYHP